MSPFFALDDLLSGSIEALCAWQPNPSIPEIWDILIQNAAGRLDSDSESTVASLSALGAQAGSEQSQSSRDCHTNPG
jgi:hypothetical protein